MCGLFFLCTDAAQSVVITGSDGIANAGDNVELKCASTGGNPVPNLTLQKGGSAPISGPSPLSQWITLVASDNGQTFECDAVNSVGTITTTLTFDVAGVFETVSVR